MGYVVQPGAKLHCAMKRLITVVLTAILCMYRDCVPPKDVRKLLCSLAAISKLLGGRKVWEWD